MKVKKVLDAKGLACPMPIVQAKHAMDELVKNDVLEVHTSDTGSQQDLLSWAGATGHEVLKQTIEDKVYKFWIRKGK